MRRDQGVGQFLKESSPIKVMVKFSFEGRHALLTSPCLYILNFEPRLFWLTVQARVLQGPAHHCQQVTLLWEIC